MKLPNWLVYVLVCTITTAWLTSFVVGLVNVHYQPPEQINLLFSSLVGGLLLNAASKRGQDDDNDDDKKDKKKVED